MISLSRIMATASLVALCAGAAQADQISDTIQSALDAYNAGDIQYAAEELAFAQQQIQSLKADGLSAFLPEAPEGFTRTVNTEMNAALGMMGGGTGAEARYEGASESFTLTLTADSPLVAQMSAMLGNAMVMAQMGGKIVRVGRLKFLDQDGSMMGLVGNRVLVQITGASNEVMLPLLEQIDFAALEGFGN
jgi:hypothetical protein